MVMEQLVRSERDASLPQRRPARTLRRSGGTRAAGRPEAVNPYVAFLTHWWWLLAVGTLLGAAGIVGYLKYGPVPYLSSASILVSPQSDITSSSLGSPSQARVSAEVYATQATSPYIYDLVSKALPADAQTSATDLQTMVQQGEMTIRAPRGGNIITIAVSDTRPQYARTLAKTFAKIFVDDVNARATADVEARRAQLEQQIAFSQDNFLSSQLLQRQDDLTKEIRQQRATLLQLQSQYQQALQQQVELDRQMALLDPGRPNANAPTPAEQQVVQQMASAATAARDQAQQLTAAQRSEIERNLADTSAQLDQVRAQLAQLPAADSSSPDASPPSPEQLRDQELARQAQAQRTQLAAREQDLARQVQNLRAQLLQIQSQQQQETRQIATLQRQIDTPSAFAALGQPAASDQPLSPAEQQKIRDAATAEIVLHQKSLALLASQQSDTEQSLSDTSTQLDQVRAQLAQLPTPTPDAAAVSPDQQRDQELARQVQAQRTQLAAREQDLARQVQSLRTQLLQVQSQQQQDVQRQLELQRQVEQDRAAAAAANQTRLTAEQQQRVRDLAAVSSRVQAQWLQVTSDQQKEVQASMADLNAQLQEVQDRLSQMPQKADPVVASAFTDAYNQRLQALTGAYVNLQLNAQTMTAPLSLYGDASEPASSMKLKRSLMMGAGGGLAAGGALAYALDMWRKRRARAAALRAPAYDTRVNAVIAARGGDAIAILGRSGRAGLRRNTPLNSPSGPAAASAAAGARQVLQAQASLDGREGS